jgi:RNA polymerase sigma-54 factor
MKLRLDLRLSQKLVMTPQLQQAIKLLQLSRLELQQTLSQHLMENPLLEEVQAEVDADEPEMEAAEAGEQAPASSGAAEEQETSDGGKPEDGERPDEISQGSWDDYFDGDRLAGGRGASSAGQDELPSYEQTLTKPTSLEDHLVWQLALTEMSGTEKAVARAIIGNVDDDGYLRTPVEDIAADVKEPVEAVESALRQVQSFDPAGVGARDLQECLLIQLGFLDRTAGAAAKRSGSLKGSLVESIVRFHLKDLEKKQYARIAKALDVTVEAVVEAMQVIEGLEPKPGRPYFSANNFAIVPDVFVVKNEGEWTVVLNDDGLPRLRVSPYYRQMMGGGIKEDSEAAKVYMEEKYRGAQWLIRSLEQRNKTILKVVRSIVKFQEPFFEQGVQHLKPLVLKQVAEDIGMHESTISRVTANKYMYCPQGMLELKFFFNTALQRTDQSQDALSSVTVREMIRKMIAEEDPRKPLKDEEIAARLQNHQIIIARRTVAKYRSEVNIPSASQRKQFF